MRRSAAVFVLAVVLGACADPPVPRPAGDDPAAPTLDERDLAIYETLITELVGGEGPGEGSVWERVVIVSKLCANAAEPFPPEGCDHGFSEVEQEELARRLNGLGTSVTFVPDPRPTFDEGLPHTIVVRVGPIAAHGEGVAVGGSYVCGGLCGSGTTYLLEERPRGWTVVGNSGSVWIA